MCDTERRNTTDSIISNSSPNPSSLEQKFRILKKPKSLGRYRNEDLSQFDATDLDTVKTFGYSMDI